MLKIEEFVERNGMRLEVKREMIEILNESLLEISKGILEKREINKKVESKKENKKGVEMERRRYKSKKAEEYAEEHGISLEDFEEYEVSKKDVEMKVRKMIKDKNEGKSVSVVKKETKMEKEKEESKSEKRSEVKREKVICSGINKKGEACKSVGTIQPEGAKRRYCFRHAEDYRSFECESDSSDEEECKDCEEKVTSKDNSDNELAEEEYN
jgi:hypothetical protein